MPIDGLKPLRVHPQVDSCYYAPNFLSADEQSTLVKVTLFAARTACPRLCYGPRHAWYVRQDDSTRAGQAVYYWFACKINNSKSRF
jgi:hypothetical protein